MTVAWNRKFGTPYEIVGTAKMHSHDWEKSGYYEGQNYYVNGDSVDMLEVTILKNKAGEMMVCPSDELTDLFQLVASDA